MTCLWCAVAVLVVSQSGAPDGGSADGGPSRPPAFDAQLALETFDDFWQRRDDAEVSRDSQGLVKDVMAHAPRDYELLWRSARVCWWEADGMPQGPGRKLKAQEGMQLAERAKAAHPAGGQGQYYLALTVGAYSQAVGILAALAEGLEPRFLQALEVAAKADESFDRHGPWVAKGRYWYELPWPLRNLGRAREELQRAIEKHPEHLRPRVYLAEVELADGKLDEARGLVEAVLNGRAGYDPPEAARVKGWAKPLAQQIAARQKR